MSDHPKPHHLRTTIEMRKEAVPGVAVAITITVTVIIIEDHHRVAVAGDAGGDHPPRIIIIVIVLMLPVPVPVGGEVVADGEGAVRRDGGVEDAAGRVRVRGDHRGIEIEIEIGSTPMSTSMSMSIVIIILRTIILMALERMAMAVIITPLLSPLLFLMKRIHVQIKAKVVAAAAAGEGIILRRAVIGGKARDERMRQ